MSVHLTPEHLRKAEQLVAETRAAGGLAPVDIERFWADDEHAHRDICSAGCPQVPLGIRMSHECVFGELGIEGDWYRLVNDESYRLPLCRRYNDAAERIVGRRLLDQTPSDPAVCWPPVKELHDVFEARQEWHGGSWWLMPSVANVDELRALLDRVEARLENLREFLLPPNWAEEKARITALGGRVPLYRSQRGPVTFATSVFGVENLIFLLVDDPALAGRFRDLILRAILERARILDEEAGHGPHDAPRGWYWSDDNCACLTPQMYESFGRPILKAVFDRYAPDSGDMRGHHADSNMEHILPAFGRLGLTSVNFGPNVMVDTIRRHLPRAVIHGALAPFTFSRNEEVNMVAEFLRDRERIGDGRGWAFATAGSINDGSRLTGMRLLMAAIQRWGRY